MGKKEIKQYEKDLKEFEKDLKLFLKDKAELDELIIQTRICIDTAKMMLEFDEIKNT
jgi:hypothetical protein